MEIVCRIARSPTPPLTECAFMLARFVGRNCGGGPGMNRCQCPASDEGNMAGKRQWDRSRSSALAGLLKEDGLEERVSPYQEALACRYLLEAKTAGHQGTGEGLPALGIGALGGTRKRPWACRGTKYPAKKYAIDFMLFFNPPPSLSVIPALAGMTRKAEGRSQAIEIEEIIRTRACAA